MPPQSLLADPDLEQHLGFLLAEEESLKTWFTGIKVQTRPGTVGTTDVGVWFRYPEGERQIKYPFITLDLISVEPNYDLFQSTFIQKTEGLYRPDFAPILPDLPAGEQYAIREFLPMNIVWQVAVYSRSSLHDRYLTSIFNTDLLPPRPFFITNIADNVDRRTERLGFQSADTVETTESGTKRIFRKIYTIQMLTEIPQNRFFDDVSGYQALKVLLKGYFMDSPGEYWTGDDTNDHWEVIAPDS